MKNTIDIKQLRKFIANNKMYQIYDRDPEHEYIRLNILYDFIKQQEAEEVLEWLIDEESETEYFATSCGSDYIYRIWLIDGKYNCDSHRIDKEVYNYREDYGWDEIDSFDSLESARQACEEHNL